MVNVNTNIKDYIIVSLSNVSGMTEVSNVLKMRDKQIIIYRIYQNYLRNLYNKK